MVPSCCKCNNGFSKDETYFACAIECALIGTTDIEKIERDTIRKTLKYNRRLHEKIKSSFTGDGLAIEYERFENIILKCVYGHIKYENSDTEFRRPQSIWFKPIHLLTHDEKHIFFSVSELEKAPEVGSRAMQRIFINEKGAYLTIGFLCRRGCIVILFQFLWV